ncbi:hypothetical protein K1719_024521 [Acacia pycnantha]|nr:hypothetical protein K1719_024521 [Acacia pycnantha]
MVHNTCLLELGTWISLFQVYNIGNVPPNPRCKTSSESKPTTGFDVVTTFFQKTTGIIARRRNLSEGLRNGRVKGIGLALSANGFALNMVSIHGSQTRVLHINRLKDPYGRTLESC